MPREKEPVLYGRYTGKPRNLPQGHVVTPGDVYELELLSPDDAYSFYRVKVVAPKWSIYLPYSSSLAIWEDWMPYGGEVADVQR